ncbi:MAG TPA: hypothetical protein VF789_12540 [Thermoanaerobaculia bacterium]
MRSGGWACAFVLLLLAGVVPAWAGHEQTLFFHNFDGSTLGTMPDDWEVVFSGAGVTKQQVSDDFAFTGSRSLQVVGKTGFAALVERPFTSNAPVIVASYYVLISASSKAAAFSEPSGLFCLRGENYLGTWYGGVKFDHATHKILDNSTEAALGDWTPGVWYQVRVLMDREDHRVKIWIDGAPKADFRVDTFHPEFINSIGLVGSEAAVPVYYDNVRLFLPGIQESGVLLLDKLDLLVSRGELPVNIAKELSQSVLRAMANEEAGRLVVARTNLMTFRTKVANYSKPGTPATDHPPVFMMKDYFHLTRLADQMIVQLGMHEVE